MLPNHLKWTSTISTNLSSFIFFSSKRAILFVIHRNRNRDKTVNQKEIEFKKRFGVATKLFWKIMENYEDKASLRKVRFLDSGVGYA